MRVLKRSLLAVMVAAVACSPMIAGANEPAQGGNTTAAKPDNYLPSLPAPKDIRKGINEGLQAQLPLSPDEVRWAKERMDASQYALHEGQTVKMTSRVAEVSVDPGAKSQVIHVLPGFITSLSVVGRDGTPWPIVTENVGSSKQFTVDVPALAGSGSAPSSAKKIESNGAPSNLLTIQPMFFGAKTNLMLTMKGLDVPLTLLLDSGSPKTDTTDGRVVIRLNREAPDAPPPLVSPPPPSPVDVTLLQFLERTPPKDATELRSGMTGLTAWQWNGGVIIRSQYDLVLPAWLAEVKQDGIAVYQLPQTQTVTVRTPSGVVNVVLGGQ